MWTLNLESSYSHYINHIQNGGPIEQTPPESNRGNITKAHTKNRRSRGVSVVLHVFGGASYLRPYAGGVPRAGIARRIFVVWGRGGA